MRAPGLGGGVETGDRALWQRSAAGDPDAFGQLFDLHAAAVYNHIFRRTADWSEAEDLTSAVFLQAWRRRREVAFDRDSALPWLLGVANHVLRNARRAQRRYHAALGRIASDAQARAGYTDPADDVAARVDAERMMAGVRRAVGQLPRHEREVVEMCIWSGLDQQAAALALGVAVGTVKSRLHRARRRLASGHGLTSAERSAARPGPDSAEDK
jgi:RNA polymerase sigma factor (sigma-70 family)